MTSQYTGGEIIKDVGLIDQPLVIKLDLELISFNRNHKRNKAD